MTSPRFSIAVVGSTQRTVACLEALNKDDNFRIVWIMTPSPKLIGRKQIYTLNPVHQWAEKHQLPVMLVEDKIDKKIVQYQTQPIDFLLVVDFGYYIPSWMLALPQIAPLNIHPSRLPKWRGSSPGQFCLLYGEKQSAVTLMKMNEFLDQGPIIKQLPFEVQSNWTQTEYYQTAFDTIVPVLPRLIINFVNKQKVTPQPDQGTSPLAQKLTKQDAYIEWDVIQPFLSLSDQQISVPLPSSQVIVQANQKHHSWPLTLEAASRAFQPWPGLWTIVPTTHGKKRMKIFPFEATKRHIILDLVQIEGQQPAKWNQIKNIVV